MRPRIVLTHLDQLEVFACVLVLPGILFTCLTQMVSQIKRLQMQGKLPWPSKGCQMPSWGSHRTVLHWGSTPRNCSLIITFVMV